MKGGFPPFMLPLVTFEGLHAQAQAAARPQQQAASGSVN